MSKMVNVNIKMDETVKKNMEQACLEMGLTMSSAFNVFACKVGRERRIPFEINVDPFYTQSNVIAFERSFEQLNNQNTVERSFEEFESMQNE